MPIAPGQTFVWQPPIEPGQAARESCTMQAIISAVVTDIDEDEGIVELDMTVKNTKDETRVFGTARVRLPLD